MQGCFKRLQNGRITGNARCFSPEEQVPRRSSLGDTSRSLICGTLIVCGHEPNGDFCPLPGRFRQSMGALCLATIPESRCRKSLHRHTMAFVAARLDLRNRPVLLPVDDGGNVWVAPKYLLRKKKKISSLARPPRRSVCKKNTTDTISMVACRRFPRPALHINAHTLWVGGSVALI